MSTEKIKPDGWDVVGSDGKFEVSDIFETRGQAEYNFGDSENYQIKPVCLIDPEELARLRAIEKWAWEAGLVMGHEYQVMGWQLVDEKISESRSKKVEEAMDKNLIMLDELEKLEAKGK